MTSSDLAVAMSGASRNACVAVCSERAILGICEQERITRVRGAGFNATGWPDEVVDELLRRSGRHRRDVTTWILGGESDGGPVDAVRVDRHFAHACSAFLPSSFESAAIVVCDSQRPEVSVWRGHGAEIANLEWPWHGRGFARLYSDCAQLFGFTGANAEQRLEALARVSAKRVFESSDRAFRFEDDRLEIASGWTASVEARIRGLGWSERAGEAQRLQSEIGDLMLAFLKDVRRRHEAARHLCLAGDLFTNSYFNARIRSSGIFDDVFVPVNPGTPGLAVGAALHSHGGARLQATPFCGPAYTAEEIKATLDNCKLTYQWTSETERLALALDALKRGHLVAWFEGPMEWGPRALGARSILANPFKPYVLENLNRFLKHRDMWRGYALSGFTPTVLEYFDGPARSPYMDCDYLPKDYARFQHILPAPDAGVRIQTVGPDAPPGFQKLLRLFGDASGTPMLVNTSFNGAHEPIVCSPSDAVRVFFGSGLDLLVLGEFVITK